MLRGILKKFHASVAIAAFLQPVLTFQKFFSPLQMFPSAAMAHLDWFLADSQQEVES